MNLTKFWKIFLISLMGVLFVGLVGGGIYVYLKDPFGFKVPKLDKYTDVLDWCDSSEENDTLNLDCKALLLDITVDESNNSCFSMLVITKEKELKELTVCEPTEKLSYTNEVLGYKKLMPIDMSLTYSKDNILNSYTFSNVSFEAMDEEYIHNIVNEDIANISSIELTKTLTPVTLKGDKQESMVNFEETPIQNSVNFCPEVEYLPPFFTLENRTTYSNFINEYKLTTELYNYEYLYNWDDSVIRILFACDSNLSFCDKTITQGLALLPADTTSLSTQILYDQTLDDRDKALLKEISLIYDSIYFLDQKNSYVNLSLLDDLVVNINSQNETTEEVACGLYKIFKILSEENSSFDDEIGLLSGIDVSQVTSSVCIDLLGDLDVDNTGVYLKLYFANREINDFMIYNRCNNFKSYLYEK